MYECNKLNVIITLSFYIDKNEAINPILYVTYKSKYISKVTVLQVTRKEPCTYFQGVLEKSDLFPGGLLSFVCYPYFGPWMIYHCHLYE